MDKKLIALSAALLLASCLILPVLGATISGKVYEENNNTTTALANVTIKLSEPVTCLNEKGFWIEPANYTQTTTTNATGDYMFEVQKYANYFLNVSWNNETYVFGTANDINHQALITDITIPA
jgi:hypothetical protein